MKKLIIVALCSFMVINCAKISYAESYPNKSSDNLDFYYTLSDNSRSKEIFLKLKSASNYVHNNIDSEELLSENSIEQALYNLSDSDLKEISDTVAQTLSKFELENSIYPRENLNNYMARSSKDTDYGIAQTFRDNRRQASEIMETSKKFVLHARVIYIYTMFANLVKTGGEWDLKQYYNPWATYLFRGNYRSGEYIGNYHYGYQGYYLDIPKYQLRSAAGFYQIISGTSDPSFWASYFDDPKDQEAINDGISEYNHSF